MKQELSCSILVRSNQILLKSFFFSFLYSFLPLFSPSFFLSSLHSLPPLFFLLLFSPLPFLSTLPFLSPSSLSIPLFPFYPPLPFLSLPYSLKESFSNHTYFVLLWKTWEIWIFNYNLVLEEKRKYVFAVQIHNRTLALKVFGCFKLYGIQRKLKKLRYRK